MGAECVFVLSGLVDDGFDRCVAGRAVYVNVEDAQEDADPDRSAIWEAGVFDSFDISNFPVGWCEQDVFLQFGAASGVSEK